MSRIAGAAPRSRAWLLAGILAGLGGACSPGAGAPLPPGPPVVEVTMRDFAFDYTPPPVSDRVVFRAHNAGTVSHQLTVFPLPEDLPPLDAQLRGSQRRSLAPLATVPVREPGRSDSFALELEPGQRYGFVCFARDPEGKVYALRGMSSEFRAPLAAGS